MTKKEITRFISFLRAVTPMTSVKDHCLELKQSISESEVKKKSHTPDPEKLNSIQSKIEGPLHWQPVPSWSFQPRDQTLPACPQSVGCFSDPTVVNSTLTLSSG